MIYQKSEMYLTVNILVTGFKDSESKQLMRIEDCIEDSQNIPD